MIEKEKRIKDERIIEATQKGYMGISGRFGTIVKYLGHPIIHQSSSNASFLPDFNKNEENDIPYVTDDFTQEPYGNGWKERNYEVAETSVYEIGRIFDGLNRGLNLEIKYDNESGLIKVTYNGKLVYLEIAGELEAFIPDKEWEEKVKQLYFIARTKEKESIKSEKQEMKEISKANKAKWIELMCRKWGL